MLARSTNRAESMLRYWAWVTLAGCWTANTLMVQPAAAAPKGARVARGDVAISQQGGTTTIRASHNSIINYRSFDIGAAETVQFVQPNAAARVLNRIESSTPTRIDGKLLANGQVYLVNPSGIMFGQGSVINVGQLYAAAGNLTDAHFLSNINHFTHLTATVVNQGQINAAAAALIGRHVVNDGTIDTTNYVVMAAGNDVLIGEQGGNVYLKVSAAAGDAATAASPAPAPASITNTGAITTNRARLVAADMFGAAIHNRGKVKASDIAVRSDGPVTIAGQLDAGTAAAGQTGGSVEVTGKTIEVAGATIDASGPAGGGRVRIGGDVQGQGDLPRAQATTITSDSTIRADATTQGDGGSIVIWSDGLTRVNGLLSARGGQHGGDGGFIETSGHYLQLNVVPLLDAPQGDGGTWLLDPEDITITAVTANITTSVMGNVTTFSPTLDDTTTTIDVALINMALNAGNDVVIKTASGGSDAGIITIDAPILKSADGGAMDGSKLTLMADSDIVLLQTITSTSGVLNVMLMAGGNVDVTIDSTIDTNGGSFTSTGVDFINSTPITAATIDINHSGAVTIGADLLGTTSTSVRSGNGAVGTLTVSPATTIRGNAVSLRAGDDMAGSDVVSLSGSVVFQGAAGAGTSPATFSLRQDDDILNADIPAVSRFAGGLGGVTYSLQSDDGSVTLDTAGRLNAAALTITAATGVDINGDITNTTSFASSGTTFDNTGGVITAPTISIDHSTAVTIGADLLGTTSTSVRSGNGGAGGLTVAAVTVRGTTLSLTAGNGGGGTDALSISAMAALQGGGGAGTSPTTFALIQDASIADAAIPAAAQFGGGVAGMSYTIQSVEGSVTLATASKVAGANLTVLADTSIDITVNIAPASISATATNDDIDLLNVTTTGSQTYSAGLDFTAGTLTAGTTIAITFDTTGLDGVGMTGDLIAGAGVTITGGAGDDEFTLAGGGTVGTGAITFNGGAGDDTLTVDFSAGSPIPTGGVTFNGQGNDPMGGDVLVLDGPDIDGAPAASITHAFTNANDGSVTVNTGTISYTGLEPIADNLNAAARVFTFGSAVDAIVIEDIGGADGISRIRSNNSETVDFVNPTTSLTVNAGGGADTITLDALDSGFGAAIVLNGDGAGDAITINAVTGGGGITVNGGAGNDTLTLSATAQETPGTLTFNGGTENDSLSLTGAPSITPTGVIVFNGEAGDDSLTLDFDMGTPVPDGGLTFSGGTGGSDTLTLNGPKPGGVIPITITHTADTSVVIDAETVLYSGLETINDNLLAENRVFNYGATADVIAISDDGTAADGRSRIARTGGETINFYNPIVSLIVNAGAGNDTVTLNGLDTQVFDPDSMPTLNPFAGTVTLNGQGDMDTIAVLGVTGAGLHTADGGTESDTVIGPNVANTWTINTNAGMVAGTQPFTFTATENLTGGSSTDEFDFTAMTMLSGVINGAAGSDRLDYSAIATTRAVTLTGIGSVDGFAGTEALIPGGFNNINALNGTAGTDSLTGANLAASWTLGASPMYIASGRTLTFTGFETLAGGTLSDTFTLTGAFTGSVSGGGGIDTLVGAGGTNTFTITASNAGSVTNLSGGFTSIENLSGGSAADTFKFVGSSAAISGSIDGNGGSDTLDFSMNGGGAVTIDLGGSGSTSIGGTISEIETIIGSTAMDTLVGPDATTTWSVTGPNAGSVAGVAFSSFENLTGGTQDDTFAFIGAGATLSGKVDGGPHVIEDTLDYSAFVGNVTVNLENGTATNIAGGFMNIEMWIGNGGGSNIIGKDIDNLWIITGTNTGTVNGEPFITFGDITGGNANDTFDFRPGGSISGSIFGNGQTAADVITYANNGGVAVTINLETRTAPGIGVTFNGIERITGSTSGADLFIGDNLPRIWTVSAPNGGSVAGVVFDGFENLTGGTADDRFSIQTGGSISGNLMGGAHAAGDSLDYSAYTGTVDVNLATAKATAIGGTFSQIESFTGNGATSTFTGGNGDNIWTIDGPNSGDVNGTPFIDFANLTGGSANDAFNFTTAAGQITGNLAGGGQTLADTLSYKDNGGGAVTVNLQTSTGTSIGGTFSGIESFIGNSQSPGTPGSSTLIGPNTANTWVIDGLDSGTVNAIPFFCFGNLTGGSGNDAFNFTGAAGSLSGSIAGSGNSAAGDGLSYFANGGGAVVVNLQAGTATSIGGTFSGIESFIGNSQAATPGSSTLIGFNAATTWVIDGLDSGTVNGTPFSGFGSLTGGSGDDAFNFTTAAGSLSGSILGGGQSSRDSLSYAANGGGTVTVNLQTSTATSVGGTFGQIENLIGNGSPSTLIGPNANTTWTIDGANAGSVAGFTFSGFANLTGGTGDDTFALTGNSASLSGNLDGGAQATQDSLSYAAVTGSVSVNLATGAATSIGGTLSRIEHLTGNGNNSTLIGPNANTTWTINAANAGSVGAFTFSAFGNLTGGSANDTFNFTGAAASLTGNLAGSGGADAISYAANGGGAVIVNLQTSKTTNVAGIFSSIEAFTGSASGADSITGGNVANTWTINGPNSGNVNGINFAAIENLIGGTNNDSFNFTGAPGAISGNISGGAQASQDVLSFAANGGGAVTVNLQTSTATSIGGTFSGIERFAGSGGSGAAAGSTLIGFNADATWVINAADAGTVNAIPFSGFANLTGGSGNDAFNFTGAPGTPGTPGTPGMLSGNLIGGGHTAADTLSYAANGGGAVTVNLQAGTATAIGGTFSQIENFVGSGNVGDTLIGENAVNAWSINATNGGALNAFTFSSFENLTGGSAADTFTFAAGGSISGIVNGTAGSDALDFTAIAGGRSIQLTGNGPVDGFAGSDALIAGGFTNIDALRVGSATTDLLTGVNAPATWNVTSAGGAYTSGGQTLSFSGFERLTGGSAADAFTLDFTNGSPIPAVGLTLNGAGGGDSLTLSGGGSVPSIVHDFDAADSGRIAIGTSMVNYSQFATISDQLPAAARTFNFNVIGSTTVTLDTDGSLGRIQSAGGSVPTSFAAPTASVTINTGDGDDTFTVGNLPAAFNAVPFTFNTGKGAETFTISAAACTFDATFNSDDSVTVLAGATGIGLTFNFSGDGGAETFDAQAITAKSLTITGTEFDDKVTLNGDVTTTSGGVAVTAKDIITHNITSAGGITLTHLATVTPMPIENTDEFYNMPDGTITINSDLIASGNITLSASGGRTGRTDGGLDGIPAVASVFANGDLTIMITGGFKFELTPNSKLSVNGALNINVPQSSATFGDLSAFDTITVTADTITIRMRDPANVLGLPSPGRPVNVFKDKGTDLVANNGINFNVRPTLNIEGLTDPNGSAARLRLGTVGSRNISSNLRGSSNVSALALRTPLTQEQFLEALDILVDGVSIVNTAEVITTALPQQLPPVLLSTSVGQADRETLRFMGVPAEKLTDEELAVAASMGLRFYRDVNPPLVVKDGAIQSPSRVTVNRLRPEQIASAIEIYKQVLPEYNEAPRALRQALADALAAWRQKEGKAATDPVDPISFRASMAEGGDLAKNMDKLKQVFEHLAKSNLSLRELNGSKETIARYIVPDGMTVGQLIAAIENVQPAAKDAKADAK